MFFAVTDSHGATRGRHRRFIDFHTGGEGDIDMKGSKRNGIFVDIVSSVVAFGMHKTCLCASIWDYIFCYPFILKLI